MDIYSESKPIVANVQPVETMRPRATSRPINIPGAKEMQKKDELENKCFCEKFEPHSPRKYLDFKQHTPECRVKNNCNYKI